MKIIDITQGATEKLELTFTSNGTAVDITGGTVSLIIKTATTDADADAIYNEDITVFDAPTTGVQNITFTDAETDLWAIGILYAQVKYVNDEQKVYFDDLFKLRVNTKLWE